MEYRMLPHGGEKIGVIGMGSSVVGAQKEADIIKTVRAAFDLGVNYFDMARELDLASWDSRPTARPFMTSAAKSTCRSTLAPTIPPANTAGRQNSMKSKNPSTGS